MGAVQLRLKNAADAEIARAGEALLRVCHDRDRPLLINDRPDIAKAIGADGAHVGQQDMAYDQARALLGDRATIGVTCHDSMDLAMTAAEAGADYVAFGAFFPSKTKDAKTRAPIELIEQWSTTTVVPCVAIGGITAANCAPLVKAGADFLAVIGAIWDHPDGPAAAVIAFNRAIAAARG